MVSITALRAPMSDVQDWGLDRRVKRLSLITFGPLLFILRGPALCAYRSTCLHGDSTIRLDTASGLPGEQERSSHSR